jgi:hypothetical protein
MARAIPKLPIAPPFTNPTTLGGYATNPMVAKFQQNIKSTKDDAKDRAANANFKTIWIHKRRNR